MSDSVPNEAFTSKPYDDEYVFKVPSMRFEAYKDGEFEHDERLLLTALTGRYKLKTDGFHRLLAKFIMHLNEYSSTSEACEVDAPPFAAEFRSAGELSNQIELSDLFDCDMNEDQLLEQLPSESGSALAYDLQVKRWLFAAISSLLIRARTKNAKNQKAKYRKLCLDRLRAISGYCCPLNLDSTPYKIAINFNKFEKIMKRESDALRFAICWMVLVLENYPDSRAAHLFNFCFLDSARNHGLALIVHWEQIRKGSSSDLELERWFRISENVDGVDKSFKNLTRFYKELPTTSDENGKLRVTSSRWRYCRLIDSEFFNYIRVSANLKACLAMLFVIDLIWCPDEKRYPGFVKSRENRPGLQKLTKEEEELLRKEHQVFLYDSKRKSFLSMSDTLKSYLLAIGDEYYLRFLAENEKNESEKTE